MNASSTARLLPWLILLGAGIVWGSSFALTIMALERGDHPLGIALWQTGLGAAMLIAYNALRGRMLFPISRFYLLFYIACGLLGTAVPTVLFLYAAEHVQAGVLSISTATVPMSTFAVAYLCRLDGFSWPRMTGLALGCAAILMITVPETGLPDPDAWPWVLVSVLAATCYAFENIVIGKYLSPEADPFVILAGMLLTATLLLAPLTLATGTFMTPAWPPQQVEWSIFAMAAINVVSYGLFIWMITAAGVVFASQMGYVVTLAGVAWGIVIFGEAHSLWFWGALVLMLAGLALVRPKEADGPPSIAHPGDHLVDAAGRDGDP